MTARYDWPIDWVAALAFALGAIVVLTSMVALAISVATVLLHL
ncbi:hypothetical protein GCM10010869_73370 [Mesorhizobium tianshanense]|uniref:Uncharacterized protein n=1 Tax=Mesorhizobium tianshanense TaxID=39844 RepID=A0A562MW42_9HYPH|nr:hypothetical protein [Mesorhizobium tianshanense]TWI24137.1 hypothetical protein IQ26_06361 [Mesorhizobium tianshanense]GLS41740.1 hypothetical protein GCM10010869_73370 [Mesorhizobium tianshanense]